MARTPVRPPTRKPGYRPRPGEVGVSRLPKLTSISPEEVERYGKPEPLFTRKERAELYSDDPLVKFVDAITGLKTAYEDPSWANIALSAGSLLPVGRVAGLIGKGARALTKGAGQATKPLTKQEEATLQSLLAKRHILTPTGPRPGVPLTEKENATLKVLLNKKYRPTNLKPLTEQEDAQMRVLLAKRGGTITEAEKKTLSDLLRRNARPGVAATTAQKPAKSKLAVRKLPILVGGETISKIPIPAASSRTGRAAEKVYDIVQGKLAPGMQTRRAVGELARQAAREARIQGALGEKVTEKQLIQQARGRITERAVKAGEKLPAPEIVQFEKDLRKINRRFDDFTRGINAPGWLEKVGTGLDFVNDLFRIAVLPARLPAYIVANAGSNIANAAIRQNFALPQNIIKSVKVYRALSKPLQDAFDEMAGAGWISSVAHAERDSKRLLNVPAVRKIFSFMAHGAGDFRLRQAALIHEAGKLGYKTPEDFKRLLTSKNLAQDRALIGQAENQAMVDFTRGLSPIERDIVSRVVIFYPWVRGATHWTQRSLLEHPIISAGIGAAGYKTFEEGEFPVKIGGREIKPATILPTYTAYQQARNIAEQFGAPQYYGKTGLQEALSPAALIPGKLAFGEGPKGIAEEYKGLPTQRQYEAIREGEYLEGLGPSVLGPIFPRLPREKRILDKLERQGVLDQSQIQTIESALAQVDAKRKREILYRLKKASERLEKAKKSGLLATP